MAEVLGNFSFNHPAATEIYTLSLHDALPICARWRWSRPAPTGSRWYRPGSRSEEHTSELQSHHDLVCRLLLEKKNKNRPIGAKNSLRPVETSAKRSCQTKHRVTASCTANNFS